MQQTEQSLETVHIDEQPKVIKSETKSTENEVIDIINEEEEYDDVLEKDEQFETETFLEGQADWLKYDNVREGQNCSADFRLFSPESNRPIVALSSFPGSGNTWARHLLVSLIFDSFNYIFLQQLITIVIFFIAHGNRLLDGK